MVKKAAVFFGFLVSLAGADSTVTTASDSLNLWGWVDSLPLFDDSFVDSTFYQSGPFFDRDGPVFIITRKHIDRVQPINFIDLLDDIPGIFPARHSYLGTLSDLKFPGKEEFKDDHPLTIEVDGIEWQNMRTDRLYTTGLTVGDIQRIEIHPGGMGHSGGETLIRIRTRDHFVVPAQTDVLWENGPFEMSVFHIGFRRRLGPKTGLAIRTEKIFMFEKLGFYSTGGETYSHPAAITDIYRAMLGRADSLYVDQGLRFENFSRNWDVRINTFAIPGANVTAGFEFSGDLQDDYRPRETGQTETFYNFATRDRRERFFLNGRSVRSGPVSFRGHISHENHSVKFPLDPKASYVDSTFISQGLQSTSLRFSSEKPTGTFFWRASGSLLLNEAAGRAQKGGERSEALITRAGVRTKTLGVRVTPIFENAFRRNSRFFSGKGTNRHILASPRFSVNALFPGGLSFHGVAGVGRRFPTLSARYFDNPRVNSRLLDSQDFKRIKNTHFKTGADYTFGGWAPFFSYSFSQTEDPVVFLRGRDADRETVWRPNQGEYRKISQTQNLIGLSFLNTAFSETFTIVLHKSRFDYLDGGAWNSEWGFYLRNSFEARRHFLNKRLLGFLRFNTTGRKEISAIDYYIDAPNTSFLILPHYFIFDLEAGFRIKTFSFLTRFENLSNQVVGFEPGYHLPGPVLRWGFQWQFGDSPHPSTP